MVNITFHDLEIPELDDVKLKGMQPLILNEGVPFRYKKGLCKDLLLTFDFS